MKKLLWLVVSLCLFATVATAEGGAIASYALPQGAQTFYLPDAPLLTVPDGLEPMYQLMRNANPSADVYLIRMKNGRALASVSCTALDQPMDAAALHEKWPQIARRIAAETQYVNTDAACATVESWHGFESLCIRTDLAVGEESMLLLKAEGAALCRGQELIEVWWLTPADSVYLYDETAAAELQSDCADLKVFLDSLDFSEAPMAQAEETPYIAPSVRFGLSVPKGCVIVDSTTAPEAVTAARRRYIAANPEGAATAFDLYYQDVQTEDATLLLTDDMRAAVEIYALKLPEFEGATPDGLCAMAGSIRENLRERFGAAACVIDNDRQYISGMEHAKLAYELGTEFRQTLLLFSCVEEGGLLHELDIFMAESMPLPEREALINLILQTLTYLPGTQPA